MSSHIEEYIIKVVQPMLQLITYSKKKKKKLIHILYMSVVDLLKHQTHFYKFILSWQNRTYNSKITILHQLVICLASKLHCSFYFFLFSTFFLTSFSPYNLQAIAEVDFYQRTLIFATETVLHHSVPSTPWIIGNVNN